jgi:hypothetical protein
MRAVSIERRVNMLRELAGNRVYVVAMIIAFGSNIPRVQAEGSETRKRDDISVMIAARAAELDSRIQQRMQDRLRKEQEQNLIFEVCLGDQDELVCLPCGIDLERPVAALGE